MVMVRFVLLLVILSCLVIILVFRWIMFCEGLKFVIVCEGEFGMIMVIMGRFGVIGLVGVFGLFGVFGLDGILGLVGVVGELLIWDRIFCFVFVF